MSYLIGATHYLQIKASDDVILQHITLSQFYTTVKICYAFSVCSYMKKFQNFRMIWSINIMVYGYVKKGNNIHSYNDK